MTSFGRRLYTRAFYFPFLQPRHPISSKFEAYNKPLLTSRSPRISVNRQPRKRPGQRIPRNKFHYEIQPELVVQRTGRHLQDLAPGERTATYVEKRGILHSKILIKTRRNYSVGLCKSCLRNKSCRANCVEQIASEPKSRWNKVCRKINCVGNLVHNPMRFIFCLTQDSHSPQLL